MCKCSQMKRSKEFMTDMFGDKYTPSGEQRREIEAPRWYYITDPHFKQMVGQDGSWIENDTQHTIPMVFKSSQSAWKYARENQLVARVAMSRYVEISGIRTSSVTWH